MKAMKPILLAAMLMFLIGGIANASQISLQPTGVDLYNTSFSQLRAIAGNNLDIRVLFRNDDTGQIYQLEDIRNIIDFKWDIKRLDERNMKFGFNLTTPNNLPTGTNASMIILANTTANTTLTNNGTALIISANGIIFDFSDTLGLFTPVTGQMNGYKYLRLKGQFNASQLVIVDPTVTIGTGTSTCCTVYNSQWQAQGWNNILGNFNLTQVSVYITTIGGAPSNTVNIALFNSSTPTAAGGTPTGSALATATNTTIAQSRWFNFTFASPKQLTTGYFYWLAVEGADAPNNGWNVAGSGNVYPNGTALQTTDSGGTWPNDQAQDLSMIITMQNTLFPTTLTITSPANGFSTTGLTSILNWSWTSFTPSQNCYYLVDTTNTSINCNATSANISYTHGSHKIQVHLTNTTGNELMAEVNITSGAQFNLTFDSNVTAIVTWTGNDGSKGSQTYTNITSIWNLTTSYPSGSLSISLGTQQFLQFVNDNSTDIIENVTVLTTTPDSQPLIGVWAATGKVAGIQVKVYTGTNNSLKLVQAIITDPDGTKQTWLKGGNTYVFVINAAGYAPYAQTKPIITSQTSTVSLFLTALNTQPAVISIQTNCPLQALTTTNCQLNVTGSVPLNTVEFDYWINNTQYNTSLWTTYGILPITLSTSQYAWNITILVNGATVGYFYPTYAPLENRTIQVTVPSTQPTANELGFIVLIIMVCAAGVGAAANEYIPGIGVFVFGAITGIFAATAGLLWVTASIIMFMLLLGISKRITG